MTPRALSPTGQAFYDEFSLWLSIAKYRSDEDVRPLVKRAAAHLASKPPLPEIAPCLAAMYFGAVEFEGRRWLKTRFGRMFVPFSIWILRVFAFRGRPMWNDFYMTLWALSRDPRYVGRLHSHLKRANVIQRETGHWMIGSVCQQDPEFAEHWGDVVRERGEVFA